MPPLSWPESAVFLVVLAISGYLFWLRFGKVVHKILEAKKDPNFTIRPIGPRVGKFVWEVMLQGQVIRQRPLPGLAHAFVFWGFCAFGIITMNHFAQGVHLNLIPRDSWFGILYFWLAAAFAVATAISIAGLFVRRFILRPKWLGEKLSYESGFIAFLIFLLMVTYLATFLPGMEENRALWWVHTLCILIFMPLIPHTKHLHLILSPVTVFLERPGFSDIPPLSGDEDFGLDTGKDLTQIVALQAYSCVECGRCTEHCPAANTGKLLNPKTIALGFRSYLNEFGATTDEPLIGKYLSEEAAFQCTTCGACEYQCPVGIQHLPMIVGLRRGAVNTGKWEDDHGAKLFLNLERGNALGMSANERDKFIRKNEIPIFDGTQEYCLWLGCMGAYDPQGREIITAFARVMRHLNVTFGVMKKEKCTGDPARRLGNDLAFSQLAESNLENLKQGNVKKIVAICPHCVRTIAKDWEEYGQAPEIEHHSEFMARHIDKLPAPTSNGETIVYHDPCYLGRYRNVYDEPRSIVEKYGALVEPAKTRDKSFCCGAGGGLAFLGEEKGKRVSQERAEQLVATGATVVGAACPFCNTMFRDALANVSATPPKLLDIAQIAAASLPPQN